MVRVIYVDSLDIVINYVWAINYWHLFYWTALPLIKVLIILLHRGRLGAYQIRCLFTFCIVFLLHIRWNRAQISRIEPLLQFIYQLLCGGPELA